jgi:cytochrome c biogenesis protein CcmG/thiol:disulfide interchange protein DsbE
VRRLSVGLMLCLVLGTGCERDSRPGNIGKPAPEFAVTDGVRSVDLAKLRGRVVVLNLWATWCVPCVEELPSLLQMQRQLPGVTVVAISRDEDQDAYKRFLTRYQVDLLTVRDPTARVDALYGTVQIPETYVIDREGVLRRKFVSAQDWTSPEIMTYLRTLQG